MKNALALLEIVLKSRNKKVFKSMKFEKLILVRKQISNLHTFLSSFFSSFCIFLFWSICKRTWNFGFEFVLLISFQFRGGEGDKKKFPGAGSFILSDYKKIPCVGKFFRNGFQKKLEVLQLLLKIFSTENSLCFLKCYFFS